MRKSALSTGKKRFPRSEHMRRVNKPRASSLLDTFVEVSASLHPQAHFDVSVGPCVTAMRPQPLFKTKVPTNAEFYFLV